MRPLTPDRASRLCSHRSARVAPEPEPFLGHRAAHGGFGTVGAVESLRVVSFNAGLLSLRLFGKSLLEVPFGRARLAALPAALAALEADVICMQEVFDGNHADHLAEELSDHLPHMVRHEDSGRIRLSHGQMILSRFPVISSEYTTFTKSLFGETFMVRRGILGALLDVPGGPVSACSTHTTAGTTKGPTGASTERVRAGQLAQLHRWVLAQQGPVIVCGDLNAGPESSAHNYHEFLECGYADAFVDARERLSALEATWVPENSLSLTTKFMGSPAQRIDHVLLNAEAAKRFSVARAGVVLDEPIVELAHGPSVAEIFSGGHVTLSDHYGMFAELVERPVQDRPTG